MATLGRRALASALSLSLTAAGSGVVAQERWVAAYAFAPSSTAGPAGPASAPNPRDVRGPLGPDVVEDVTLTHTVMVTASGKRIRLRLSNAYGAEPITLGAVTVHLEDMTREVRFNGERSSVMPADAPLVSDPVDLPVAALDQVKVSIALPHTTRLPTHRWRQTMRGADGVESAPMRLGVLLAGIEVESATPPDVIVAFGDSITEGTGALPDGPGGWPERLAARLVDAGRPWAVINAGIGGNRLLHQGSGPSGLERLDADALVPTGARCLILLEGVNDIGRPSRPQYAHQAVSAADLIAGYRQVIRRAHAAGSRSFWRRCRRSKAPTISRPKAKRSGRPSTPGCAPRPKPMAWSTSTLSFAIPSRLLACRRPSTAATGCTRPTPAIRPWPRPSRWTPATRCPA
nr:GDSL-type esterase/lipase family protein [uncultured Brevundimonas sp.]